MSTSQRPPRLVIVGGDTDYNRGDKAILGGMLEGLRAAIPNAQLSIPTVFTAQYAAEFGVDTFQRNDVLATLRAIRRADLVLWGGGVALQDNSSRIKVPYWLARQFVTTQLLRKPVMGIAMGIGPLVTPMGRQLAAIAARMASRLVTRDQGGKDLLIEIGVPADKVEASACTAMLISPSPPDVGRAVLENEGVLPFDGPLVGFSTRLWFHHQSRWIPHEWAVKYKLRPIYGKEKFARFSQHLARLADNIVERYKARILFFPMYTVAHEADQGIARDTIQMMSHSEAAHVLSSEYYAIKDFMSIFGHLDLFVGMRMHSTILSTRMSVPTINISYVPKGYKYFAMIGQSHLTFSAEQVAEGNIDPLVDALDSLMADLPAARAALSEGVAHTETLAWANIANVVGLLREQGFDIPERS